MASSEDGAAALTDARGTFELQGVRGGIALLLVVKPGYNSPGLSESYTTAIEVRSGMAPLTLKLDPPATISGQVLDSDDQPVANARVVVLRVRMNAAAIRSLEYLTAQTTDAHGRYRVDGIPAGQYAIELAQSITPRLIEAGVPNGRTGVWPNLYFPGTTDADKAQSVHLRAGEQFQASFTVAYEPAMRLSGMISGLPAEATVEVFRRGSAGSDYHEALAAGGGHFTCQLPAGSYLVVGRAAVNASGLLEVDTDRKDAGVAMSPMLSIPVRVHYEGAASGQQLPSPAMFWGLTLVGTLSERQLNPVWNPEASSFTHVIPGDYALFVQPYGPWRLKSARYGEADVMAEKLVIRPSATAQTLDIVLTDDAASLLVTIPSLFEPNDRNLEAMAQSGVNSSSFAILIRRTGAGPHLRIEPASGRKTEIANLAPGDYEVVAIPQDAQVPVRDEAALDRLFAMGQRVHLDSRARAPVTLSVSEGENGL